MNHKYTLIIMYYKFYIRLINKSILSTDTLPSILVHTYSYIIQGVEENTGRSHYDAIVSASYINHTLIIKIT